MKKKCKTCRFSSRIGNTRSDYLCNYIIMTGVPRGCPVDDCDKYQSMKRKVKKNETD